MFGTYFKPEATRENDQYHFEHLQALDSRQQWAVKYLYDRLGIIDNKTSALLRVNGIIIGFVTVAVFRVAEKPDIVAWPVVFLSVCAAIFLLLAFAEIMGARIFYLAFDRVTPERTFADYRDTTMEITIKREGQYRALLWTSVLGMTLFIVLFLAVTAADIVKLSWHPDGGAPAVRTEPHQAPPAPAPAPAR